MNGCVNGGSADTLVDCAMPPQTMMGLPPSYWSHQQQQQQQMIAATSMPQQLHEMPPSTSQSNNFPPQFMAQQQQLNMVDPNSTFQQQFNKEQLQFQQKNGQFQLPMNNFSPGSAGGENAGINGIGRQQLQQQQQHQISSPSVTSTADLQANGGGGNPAGCFMNYQQQPFGMPPAYPGQQPFLNGEPNNNGNGGDGSPMARQMAAQGQQMLMMGQGQQQQRWIPQPPQMPGMTAQNGAVQPTQMGMPMNGMPPNMMPHPQLLFPGMNGNEKAAQNGDGTSPRCGQIPGIPPQFIAPKMMMGVGGVQPERQSFLFTTDMANKAAMDVQQRHVPDLAHWHLMYMRPSTSNASFEQQRQMQLLQQQPPTSTSRSPQAPASRTTKRKASNRATTPQEQHPHSLSSPAQHQHETALGAPASVPATAQSVPGSIDAQQQQRHSSVDICDSTNGDIGGIFKRPSSRMPPSHPAMLVPPPSYMSPNPGAPQTNCYGRMDDENPLKKMEIMTSKTLNEQPANKMARLLDADGGQQEQQHNNFNDISMQEKMRKLQEIEKSLSHFNNASSDNNCSPTAQPQQPPFGAGTAPQPTMGAPHPAAFMQMQGDGFCGPPGAPPMMPFLPPGMDPGQQFRPPPFFPGQIPPNFPAQMSRQMAQQQQQNSPTPSASAPAFYPPQFAGVPPQYAPQLRMPMPPNGFMPNQQFGNEEQQQMLQNGNFPMGAPNGCWNGPAMPNGPQPVMAGPNGGGPPMPMQCFGAAN